MQSARQGLRWKITVFLSTVVLVVMTLLSVGDYLWQRQTFLGTLNDHIAEESRLLAALIANARSPDDIARVFTELVPTLDHPGDLGDVHEIFLLDRQGVVIASNRADMVGQRMWNEDVAQVLQGQADKRFGVMWHGDHLSYYGVLPLRIGTSPPVAAIHIAEPYAPILARMRQFLNQRLMFMALVTLALILATIVATNYVILGPLERLAATIARVSHGDLDTHVDIRREDELGAIAAAFNRMVDALRAAHRREEEEHERLAVLYKVNRRLAGITDWETLVDVVCHLPEEIVPATGTMFLSYDERTRRFALEKALGLSPAIIAALEQHVARLENPACLACIPRMAHMEDSCPLLVPGLLSGDRHTMLCLHLAQGEHTVGFLYVFLPPDADLTPAQVDLLNAVSGEITAAVAAAQARARELALLANLEKTPQAPASLDDTLRRILDQTLAASAADRGAIFLFDAETHHLYPGAWVGLKSEEIDEWRGLAWQGLHRREPLTVSRRPISARQSEHIVVVPLSLGDETLGAILLAGAGTRAYTRHHLTFLSAIAAQTALIVQTARLYERLEQHAILEERTRLAREIHDGLAQHLAFVRWKMYQVRQWLAQGQEQRLEEELALLQQVVDEAYLDVREAIDGLRLPLDESTSFADALREYARRFVARTGITVDLALENVALPPGTEAQLLRVVQEALTNVRKHARASHITVTLTANEDAILLQVSDDGIGFDPEGVDREGHFGLRIMAERVQGLGGRLDVHAAQGCGTTLTITLPRPHIRLGGPRDEEDTRAGRG